MDAGEPLHMLSQDLLVMGPRPDVYKRRQ
ncbi:hypothetical protein HaLaN_23226 [Haematococcus lacustris]|uniref:Uncharacterized protein n=1 Tax=Haematococcus lacustris TaxID=44745 RepID=A0A6A0A1V7_HAELA|nr:hypothetical protein HaLaN_23226 [Haematococcus lacustris]